jgi:meso-butanediol dehydrogenase / (S,S)-butanediol dehydrogenase / diacetyl reductase
MDRLKDRVAIVTGGASGIGRATALLLAREGAKVVICDLNDAQGAETVQAIHAAGGQARFRHADVTIASEVQGVVDDALSHFRRLDILLNNAGISLGDSVLDIDEPTWDRNLAVVLKGPYLFTRAALPAMRERRRGVIVNVASVNGLLGLGEDAYSAAKAGLINFTQNVAIRYGAEGIRANVICPGTVRTPIWQDTLAKQSDVFERLARWYPLGRVGEPEDIAQAALFLASDDASWITGAVIPVDGGLTAGLRRMAVDLQGEG